MNETILALAIYIAWTMLLILALAVYRTVYNKKYARTSLKFDSSGNDVGALGSRLTRAHANCYESFAFVGAVMLLALATNSSYITDPLALVVVGARIIQSCIHISSTKNTAISIRFVFFLIQFFICAYWLFCLVQKFI